MTDPHRSASVAVTRSVTFRGWIGRLEPRNVTLSASPGWV